MENEPSTVSKLDCGRVLPVWFNRMQWRAADRPWSCKSPWFFSLKVSRIIISDNGKNLVRTVIRAIRRMAQDDSTRNYLLKRKIDRRFNASYAPWWWGLVRPSQDGLATVLAEAAHIITSRLLLQHTQDGRDEESLTPALLLHGVSSTLLPSDFAMDRLKVTAAASHLRQQEKQRKKSHRKFWTNPRQSYRTNLLQFHLPGMHKRPIEVGEVVLIHWRLTLETVHNGTIRQVRTGNGSVFRPIQRLCPLEIREDLQETASPASENTTLSEQTTAVS